MWARHVAVIWEFISSGAGNLFKKFERVYPGYNSGYPKMFEFECAYTWLPVQVASSEEAGMPEQNNGGAVRVLVS